MKDFDSETQEVRSYVRNRMRGDLPPNFVEDVMSDVYRTPQRRRGWIGWPLLAGIATVAAGAALVAMGLSVIDGDGVGGDPTPTSSVSASPEASATPAPSADQCINPPIDAITLVFQTDPVACYGGADLTFPAHFTGGVGAIDCPAELEPAWFACQAFVTLSGLPGTAQVPEVRLAARSRAPFYFAVLHPRVESFRHQLGGAVSVTGHFDDPAAQTCRYAIWSVPSESPPPSEEVVLRCRSTFVITAMEPFDPATLRRTPLAAEYLDLAEPFNQAGCIFSSVLSRFNQVPSQATQEELADAAVELADAYRTFADRLAAVEWPSPIDADAEALVAAVDDGENALRASAATMDSDYESVVIPVVAAANRLRAGFGLPSVSGFGCLEPVSGT